MRDIIFRLLDFINNHKTKDTNYYIALNLLKDIHNIAHINISVLAETCYTSPAAITRFCKKIGYSSFQEFKNIAKHENIDNPIDELIDRSLNVVEIGDILQDKLYNKMVGWLASMESKINVSTVQSLLTMIHEGEKVSFFGTQLSQAMAQDFQYRLVKCGKLVHAFSDIQEQLADASELNEHSVAIITSPSGRFIERNADLMKLLRDTKAKVIIITHNIEVADKHDPELVYHLHGMTYDQTGYSSERYALMYFFDFAIAFYQQMYPID